MSLHISTKNNLLKSTFIISVLSPVLLLSFAVGSWLAPSVDAEPVTGFVAGRIIDDAVFTNSSTMTIEQIQSFLNQKVPTCDTNGLKASEYGGPDLNGDGKVQRWEWGQAYYNQNTFTCLRNYVDGGKSSAQLIYDTAQEFDINPQILIVLLQKEQGLIQDEWPLNVQYRSATGYGCPDTAACDSQYYGLTNQIRWAATMFRAIINASPTWYTPYLLGNNYIQYNPNANCGGSNVNIENRATQALYNYTPYQPNQAALDAGWGTVNCGAYGNRNFYLYFKDWFGNTIGPDDAWSPMDTKLYADASYTNEITNSNGAYYLYPGQKAYLRITAQNIGRTTWDKSNTFLGTHSPYDYASPFADSSWLKSNRPSNMIETTVAPNQKATFQFSITAPTTQNKYRERYSVVHEGISWIDNTYIDTVVYVPSEFPATELNSGNRIPSGATIPSGQYLYSPQKRSVLRLNVNGNLELYTNFVKVWESKTAGLKATKLVNQSDGNLALYTENNVLVWSSGTSGNGPSELVLQPDGNLVLYSGSVPTWSSATSAYKESLVSNQFIISNGELLPGQSITSPDRKYRLILQGDGNLVLYSPNRATWSSATFGQMDKLRLQGDGNLVLYDLSNKPVWSTKSFGTSARLLEMQQDANLVLYTPSKHVWSSQTYLVN